MTVRTRLPSGLVTFMFTDIEGSTRLARMLGPDYRPVLGEHRKVLRRTLSAKDGTELFTEGDSFFVAFADAAAALDACLIAQRALAQHDWPLPDAAPLVRMGLHTGLAEPYAGEYTSAEVHRAARVAAAAHGGQVLCSAATARYADALPTDASLLDLGLHRLRGFDDSERLFQLVAPGLRAHFPRPRTPRAAAHNLPAPLTSFVGRRAERAELCGLLSRHRLVTVVGAGGSGKTRLGVEVARSLLGGYPGGVWLVDVAALDAAGPEAVTAAVATVLGVRPEPGRPILDTLLDHLAGTRILLVLDTCDADVAAVAQVAARLLTGAPGLRVLATGREPLAVPGEVVWRIPALSARCAPDGGSGDAVRLLADRVAAARGGRAPGPAEAADLHRVAARLDGLPLALELAASRLRLLSAGQLVDRLDDVLSVLDAGRRRPAAAGRVPAPRIPAEAPTHPPVPSAARHATMRASVSWSYRTLPADAVRLLGRLAAFAGPVELAAVEWMADSDPLDPLAVLVDKSLVQADPAPGGTRYRLLDPIRAYAAGRLAEDGDEHTARDRHAAWVDHGIRAAQLDPDGRPATLSLDALEPYVAEARAALRWSVLDGSPRQGLAIVTALDPWWRERGEPGEARRWLNQLYPRMDGGAAPVPTADLVDAYLVHAAQACADGEPEEGLHFCHRAERLARRLAGPVTRARVFAARGPALAGLGRLAEAEEACRDALRWATAHGVPGAVLPAVVCLGEILCHRGDLDEAADLLGAARPAEAGEPRERGRRTVDMLLGLVALRRGDLVAAHDHLVVALRSRMRHGFRRLATETVAAMAARCVAGGDPVAAATLFGAAGRRAGWAAQQAAARSVAGDAAFDRAYADGAALDLDGAVAFALTVEHPDLAADSARFTAA